MARLWQRATEAWALLPHEEVVIGAGVYDRHREFFDALRGEAKDFYTADRFYLGVSAFGGTPDAMGRRR